ncbi:hypothetical protein GCM10007855_42070 [Aliivibrio sifiae]|uniref:Uncharacterized protein n=1 Tax=Aliivibrio sifiae TaxID=566293 RepID=A0ABQ6ATQ5_9GAMM|nr:hypothetical protein GCM10007855_42070 [Aliivibrio sifiae]
MFFICKLEHKEAKQEKKKYEKYKNQKKNANESKQQRTKTKSILIKPMPIHVSKHLSTCAKETYIYPKYMINDKPHKPTTPHLRWRPNDLLRPGL